MADVTVHPQAHSNLGGVHVALLFAEAHAAIEVAWSLLAGGVRITAVTRAGRRPALAYARHVQLAEIPAPERSIVASRQALNELVERQGIEHIFPLDDAALALVASAPTGCHVLGPLGDLAELALDKRQQIEAATRAGFVVPASTVVTQTDQARRLSTPIILKPARAMALEEGALVRGPARYCADREELEAAADALPFSSEQPYLAQAIVRGRGRGIFGLATDNGVVHWSGHRRVRMMNPAGSSSSACEPATVEQDLREMTERFIELTEWRGLFMIELLEDEEGRDWFIELNGRPWGSMALARDCGFEYPAWALELARDPHAPLHRHPSKRPVRIARHLGRELVHLLFVLRGRRTRADIPWPSVPKTLLQLCRPAPGVRWFNWQANEWRVFVVDSVQTVLNQVRGRTR